MLVNAWLWITWTWLRLMALSTIVRPHPRWKQLRVKCKSAENISHVDTSETIGLKLFAVVRQFRFCPLHCGENQKSTPESETVHQNFLANPSGQQRTSVEKVTFFEIQIISANVYCRLYPAEDGWKWKLNWWKMSEWTILECPSISAVEFLLLSTVG